MRPTVDRPVPDVADAAMMTVVERVDTGDVSDLVGVYEALVGDRHCDSFDERERAVAVHERGEWKQRVLHELGAVERKRERAVLTGRYVSTTEFTMKTLPRQPCATAEFWLPVSEISPLKPPIDC